MKRTFTALAAASLLSAAALVSGGTGAEALPALANMSRIDTGAQQVHWRRWHHCHRHCNRWRCWRDCHGGHRHRW